MKPVLLVTGRVHADRVPCFAALHEREGIELALWGGRAAHGPAAPPGAAARPAGAGDVLTGVEGRPRTVPHRHVAPREVAGLAASGRYRAVVAGLSGRVALAGAYLGTRRARVPFVLWASLWAHPRTVAHAASHLPTLALYRRADAVVTYGPHVADYVRRRGARRVHVAPQAVDPAFWSAPAPAPRRLAAFQAVFTGRDAPEKGLDVVRAAWARSGLEREDAALALVGVQRGPHAAGIQPPVEVRNFLGGSDVLVLASLRTRSFREPWGLAVNEAMHQGLPVIASTEVGAVAGGLLRDEGNGIVVPAGDPDALTAALRRLHDDAELRRSLGAAAIHDVSSYTPEAWAAGVSAALADVGASRAAA